MATFRERLSSTAHTSIHTSTRRRGQVIGYEPHLGKDTTITAVFAYEGREERVLETGERKLVYTGTIFANRADLNYHRLDKFLIHGRRWSADDAVVSFPGQVATTDTPETASEGGMCSIPVWTTESVEKAATEHRRPSK